MSATTRELSIVYNSFTIGGTARPITRYQSVVKDRDRLVVEASFVVTAASEAAFATECQAVELAFSTPYKNLTVTQGSTDLIAVTQSGNTGLDALPTVTKRGEPGDSGRSRTYSVRIELGLPASWNTSYPGLRDATIDVVYSPSRVRAVTFSGTWTAISSSSARTQYEAQIASYVSATMSALGITTYELDEEPRTAQSVNDKTIGFTRTYRELFYSQAGSSNDSAIVREVVQVWRRNLGSEHSPAGSQSAASAPGATSDTNTGTSAAIVPLAEVGGRFDCWIDKTVTTDLTGKYAAIRDWIIERVREAIGSTSFALMSERPSFDRTDNRISVDIEGIARDPGGTSLVALKVDRRTDETSEYQFVPAWTGGVDAHFVYRTVRDKRRTTTVTQRSLVGSGGGAGGAGSSSGGGGTTAAGPSGLFGIGVPSIGVTIPGITESPSGFTLGGFPAAGGGTGGTTDQSGAGFGLQQPGGASGWLPVSTSENSTDVEIGRPPFVIQATDTTTMRVEKYVVAINRAA